VCDRQPVIRISSYCQDGGCVGVGWDSPAEVVVVDIKNLEGPVVPVGAAAWRRFLHNIPEPAVDRG
jgi:hypothetical protein